MSDMKEKEPRLKLTKGIKKDYKVTVRLDHDTYEDLIEAIKKGKITNLSEALRSMIRQKVWEERFSDEIGQDLRLNEVSDKDLREIVNRVFGDFNITKNRQIVKQDGFLEGLFSALGPIVRRAVAELERREADKRSDGSATKNVG